MGPDFDNAKDAPEDMSLVPGAPRIIIADDTATSRKLAALFLETAGYEVTGVTNGRELLDAVHAASYDLVLTDVFMAGMNGLEAAAKIRALANGCAQVPIIAMSAVADLTAFARTGINDFIAKPISRQALLETVNRWLPKRDHDSALAGQPHSTVENASLVERLTDNILKAWRQDHRNVGH